MFLNNFLHSPPCKKWSKWLTQFNWCLSVSELNTFLKEILTFGNLDWDFAQVLTLSTLATSKQDSSCNTYALTISSFSQRFRTVTTQNVCYKRLWICRELENYNNYKKPTLTCKHFKSEVMQKSWEFFKVDISVSWRSLPQQPRRSTVQSWRHVKLSSRHLNKVNRVRNKSNLWSSRH